MNSAIIALAMKSKTASKQLNFISEEERNKALCLVAERIRAEKDYIIKENKKDINEAIASGKNDSFIDRLMLNEKVIEQMAEGIEQVSKLVSPLGKVSYSYENQEQGIKIEKKAVPFGVIGIIYESRPNVTADAFALCFKTANAVILKGGKESINSNLAIVKVIKSALKESGITEDAVAVIEDTSRETTKEFMKLNKFVDLLIPRGGASLIKTAVENSTIPIIETGTGNCHVYVDSFADANMSANVIKNAKTQRYSVCNACESIVIHKAVLEIAMPKIANALKDSKVEIRADKIAMEVIKDYPYLVEATEEDFYTEYGGPIISVKTVDSLQQAIEHINEHSTHHSESIITANSENAQTFLNAIDSSSVYWNASTRFTDGFVFGLGAEIGISTQKLHARGPMGLEALVTQKYVIVGNGAVRK